MDDVQRQFNQNNVEHKTIMKKLEEFSDKLSSIEVTLAKLPQELIDLFDNRYASKKTETAIYWMAGVLFVALVGLGTFIIETLIKQ